MGDKTACAPALVSHTEKAEHTVEACHASSLPRTSLCCSCSCNLDREIDIFINFLKISLSNIVSRANFLPLRSGQKKEVCNTQRPFFLIH